MIEYIFLVLTVDRDENWVDKLIHVEFEINSLVADSTGKMPFEVCYGLNVQNVTDYLDGMHRVEEA